MPLFKRTSAPKPPPEISIDLPSGEGVERGARATLLQGKAAIKGTLFLTNRRIMFEAERGDTRWLVVPYGEVRSAGVFPAPNVAMGRPGRRPPCLFIETTKGEHVWLSFGDKEQREWTPLIEQYAAAAREDTPLE
jgi:hypothetical protein